MQSILKTFSSESDAKANVVVRGRTFMTLGSSVQEIKVFNIPALLLKFCFLYRSSFNVRR